MPVLVEGAPTYAITTTASVSQRIDVPTGVVNGELLVWVIGSNNLTQAPVPAGWTLWKHSAASAAHTHSVWYRIANNEPAAGTGYTASGLASARWVSTMIRISGFDTAVAPPRDVADPAHTNGTTTNTWNPITPVTAGALILAVGTCIGASGAVFDFTGTNVTIVAEPPTQTGVNVGMALGIATWSTGAFTPAMTKTGVSTRAVGTTLAIKPSGAVTPTKPPFVGWGVPIL